MSSVSPRRVPQERVTGRKSSRRSFAVHPNVTEIRMPLLLYQVVADLIDQLELRTEHCSKRFRHSFKDHESIQNCVIAAGSNGVQIIFVMPRLRSEVAQVNVRNRVRPFLARPFKIICRHAMSETATARVDLHKQRPGHLGSLQFDEVVSATQASQL